MKVKAGQYFETGSYYNSHRLGRPRLCVMVRGNFVYYPDPNVTDKVQRCSVTSVGFVTDTLDEMEALIKANEEFWDEENKRHRAAITAHLDQLRLIRNRFAVEATKSPQKRVSTKEMRMSETNQQPQQEEQQEQNQAADQAQDDNDFPLGKACDLSGEGNCEACQ